jgi:tripartite-type tricarboxylate transporter receptor subunit TctC
MQRRVLVKFGVTSLVFAGYGANVAQADNWKPSRRVTVIVPTNPGSGVDTYARAVSLGLAERFGVPFAIVNRPGSSGIAGTIETSNASPDGQTLLITSISTSLIWSMFSGSSVNPIDSFDIAAQIGSIILAIAVPKDSPIQNAQDLLDAARSNPRRLRWAHAGRGNITHIAGQMLLDRNDVKAIDIPFKGGSRVRAAIMGNHVDFAVLGIQQLFGYENYFRLIGCFSDERYPLASTLPTLKEQGIKKFDIGSNQIGLLVPKKTPIEIVKALEVASAEIVSSTEFADFIKPKGLVPDYKSGADAISDLVAMRNRLKPILN